VVNQWGRDGNFSSSGRSSGAGGIIVTAVIALLIGAGAGYGGARFLAAGSQTEIAARDARIAELQAKLAKSDALRLGEKTSDTVLRSRVSDLEEQVAAQKRTNASLKEYADEQLAKGREEAQAELDALKETLDQAGDAAGQLAKARKSLQVSELQIIELESTIRDQQAQISKLRDDLSATVNQGDAGVKALQAQIKSLETELAKARTQAAEAAVLSKRNATLEDKLGTAQADRDAATKQVAQLKDKQQSLVADLKAARDALEKATVGGGEVEKLQAALRELKETAAQKDADIGDLRARVDGLKDDLSQAQGEARAAEALRTMTNLQLGQMKAENEALQTQIAGLKKMIADLKDKATPSKDDVPKNTGDDIGGELQPRDPASVASALSDTPGYAGLSAAKQALLAEKLEQGECVSDALKAAFGRVPAVALRNLIRDLGSRC
jgi:chromosome segregation ATPase